MIVLKPTLRSGDVESCRALPFAKASLQSEAFDHLSHSVAKF